jgi:lysine-specific demethylase/histidyl-hydroxylase NO66
LLARRSELRQGFEDLFSLEVADEILSTRGLRTPFIRIAKDGAIIDSSQFTGPGGVGATIGDQVVDDRILELFASGHTVVLQALHRLWPPLVEFAGALSADLAHPVQINAYITPRQSQGFSAHYDVHDVFVLQIAGSKRWVIHDPVHPDPLPSQPWTRYRRDVEARAAEDPSADHVLEAGDVLYLPRGFIHSAEALGGVSAHLTIGIHAHTRHDLVRALLELVEEDPELRRSLPLGVDIDDPAQLSSDLAATVTALVEQIQAVSVSDVAPVMARRARASTRPAPIGPLAQAAALEALSTATTISLRPRQPITMREDGERVVLEHPGGSLTFAAPAAAALTALLVGDPVLVGSIPGLDDEERLEIVERLMRAGIVVAGSELEARA